MWRFITQQWFLLMLAFALALGFWLPGPFAQIANSTWIRNGIVASVLFVMSLPLEASAVVQTIRRPAAALLSSVINMGVLPLLAWAMSFGLSGDLAIGFVVTAAVPCTLASAAVWTRRAGGNDAVALMVTVLTNATCFVFTPLWIVITTAQATPLRLTEMISKLGLLVVLPMVVAQLVRRSSVIAAAATRRKQQLSTFAQLGMLCMVLIGAVNTRQSLAQAAWADIPTLMDFVVLAVFVVALHLAVLALGIRVSRALHFDRADAIAIAIAGSQKTLMVGLYITINYFGGLVLIPLVMYHVAQLFIDTILADLWRRKQPQSAKA